MTSQGSLMTSPRGLKARQREDGLLEGFEGPLQGSEGPLQGSEG